MIQRTIVLGFALGSFWAAAAGAVPGQLRFVTGSLAVQENIGSVSVSVLRTGGDDGAVSVQVSTGTGSATPGTDYTPVNTTLSWADHDDAPKSFSIPINNDGFDEQNETVTLSLSNPVGGATLGSPATATLTILDDDNAPSGPCSPDEHTLCLLQGRFRLQVQWRTNQGQVGEGMAVPIRDFSGAFSFFNPDNLEMLVKVIDACGLNNRFWVFFAATTNVEFTLRVTDTDNTTTKTYFNELNNTALPIQDTNAFETCP